MGVSKNRVFVPPKSSILIGFSIIFTIHFGGPPLFWRHPYRAVEADKNHLKLVDESRQGRLERYLPDDVASSDESLNFIETLGKRDGQRGDLWVVGILLVY